MLFQSCLYEVMLPIITIIVHFKAGTPQNERVVPQSNAGNQKGIGK